MPIAGLRARMWSRKWTRKDWVIASVGLFAIVFAVSSLPDSIRRAPSPSDLRNGAPLVDLTLLRNAKGLGARTPPQTDLPFLLATMGV